MCKEIKERGWGKRQATWWLLSCPSCPTLHPQNSGPSILTWAGCKLRREVRVRASTCVCIQVLSLKLAEEWSWLCHLRAWGCLMGHRRDRMSFLECVRYEMIALWEGIQNRVLWSWKDGGWFGGKLWALIGGRLKEKSCTIQLTQRVCGCLAMDWMLEGKNKSLRRFKAATGERRVPFLLLLVVQVTDLLWLNDLNLLL